MCSVYLSMQIFWVWQCGLYLRLQQPAKVRDTHLYDMAWVIQILHQSHVSSRVSNYDRHSTFSPLSKRFQLHVLERTIRGLFSSLHGIYELILFYRIFVLTECSGKYGCLPLPECTCTLCWCSWDLQRWECWTALGTKLPLPGGHPFASTHCPCSASEPALECQLSQVCCHAHLCKSDGALLERGVLYTEGGWTFFYLLLHG